MSYKCYSCPSCLYVTKDKSDYNKHLNKLKHKNNVEHEKTYTEQEIREYEEKKQQISTGQNIINQTCPVCFLSNASKDHLLGNNKICEERILYAEKLIDKHSNTLKSMSVDDLLQEFHDIKTIKSFSIVFKNTYDLKPADYIKGKNGHTRAKQIASSKPTPKEQNIYEKDYIDEKEKIRSPLKIQSANNPINQKTQKVTKKTSKVLKK